MTCSEALLSGPPRTSLGCSLPTPLLGAPRSSLCSSGSPLLPKNLVILAHDVSPPFAQAGGQVSGWLSWQGPTWPLPPAPCRYWLDYETYLVEGRLRETVDLPFLKAVVKNVSTSIAGDLHFSLSPSQVTRPCPCWPALAGFPGRGFQNSAKVTAQPPCVL